MYIEHTALRVSLPFKMNWSIEWVAGGKMSYLLNVSSYVRMLKSEWPPL